MVVLSYLPVSVYVFYLVYLSVVRYRARNSTLWLLVADVVPMFLFSSTTLILVFYTRNLIQADPSELSAAYEKYVAVLDL